MERDFKEVLDCLAIYMKNKHNLKTKPKQKFMASLLNVKESDLTVWKSRNNMKFKVILDFCLQEDINPLNVFYNRLKLTISLVGLYVCLKLRVESPTNFLGVCVEKRND